MEICLKDLQEDYMGGTDVKISEPVVSFRETVSAESSTQCLSKSPNKHNRLYLSACPLESGIPEDVEEGRLNPRDDAKVRVLIVFQAWLIFVDFSLDFHMNGKPRGDVCAVCLLGEFTAG